MVSVRELVRSPIGYSGGLSQIFENTGGPGRTRTCNQTVMSGRL